MIRGWPMSRSTSGATAATASSRARTPAATTRWSARPPSNANGKYAFNNLSAGTYFVQEVAVPGLVISSSQSVQTVVITNADLQGTPGMTIDSFASTSQYVSGSLHGGKTGTSSESAPEAIGGHRNLYVQLTTAGGAVSLGANSDWPGLLDFGANAASNGTFWVNWDGNNSNPAVLNPTGLGGVDITSQGASTGIELNVAADHDGGYVMLKVYTRCQRLVFGHRSHSRHQRWFAEQQRQPVRRLLQLHRRRRHGGQLLPGRRHPVVDQRRECHRRPGGTDRGRGTEGLQRELRQRGPGRPVRGQVGPRHGRGRAATHLHAHGHEQRSFQRHGRDRSSIRCRPALPTNRPAAKVPRRSPAKR